MQKLPDYIIVASPNKIDSNTLFQMIVAIVNMFVRIAKKPFSAFSYTQGTYEFYCAMANTGNKTLKNIGDIVSGIGFSIGSILR